MMTENSENLDFGDIPESWACSKSRTTKELNITLLGTGLACGIIYKFPMLVASSKDPIY